MKKINRGAYANSSRKFSNSEMIEVLSKLAGVSEEKKVRIIPIFSKSKSNVMDLIKTGRTFWESGSSYKNIIKPGDILIVIEGENAYLGGRLTGKILEKNDPEYPSLSWTDEMGSRKYALEVEKIKSKITCIKKEKIMKYMVKEKDNLQVDQKKLCRTTPLLMKSSDFEQVFQNSMFPLKYNPEMEESDNERVKNGLEKKHKFTPENYLNSKKICKKLNEMHSRGIPLYLLLFKEMQAGKTQEIECFFLTCLPELMKGEILLTSGLEDLCMRAQNLERLGSKMRVEGLTKMTNELKKGNNPFYGTKVLVLEEDQVGQGEEGQVGGMIERILNENPGLIILRITATPGGSSVTNTEVLKLITSNSYRGISKFLANDQILDISDCYDECSIEGDEERSPYFYTDPGAGESELDVVEGQKKIKPTFASELSRLNNKEGGGLGLIRHSDPLTAKNRIETFCKKNGLDIEIVTAHTNSEKRDHQFTIMQSANLATRLVLDGKKVLFIGDKSLTASFDFDANTREKDKKAGDTVKSRIVFAFETIESNSNSALQGYPGRICGYHNNEEVRIYMNREIAGHYSNLTMGLIDFQEYDKRASTSLKSNGRLSKIATHIDTEVSTRRGHTKITPIELSFDGYKESLSSMSGLLSSIGWESSSLSFLIDKCMESNKDKFGTSHMVSVGKKESVTDSKGKLYYPNGMALSNNKDKNKFLATYEDFARGNGSMEHFTQRSKDNPNRDIINVGIKFDDENRRFLLCLKGEWVDEEVASTFLDKTYLPKINSMNL